MKIGDRVEVVKSCWLFNPYLKGKCGIIQNFHPTVENTVEVLLDGYEYIIFFHKDTLIPLESSSTETDWREDYYKWKAVNG